MKAQTMKELNNSIIIREMIQGTQKRGHSPNKKKQCKEKQESGTGYKEKQRTTDYAVRDNEMRRSEAEWRI